MLARNFVQVEIFTHYGFEFDTPAVKSLCVQVSQCDFLSCTPADNSDSGSYVFVADRKSWRDAQDHCRDLSSDLVGIQSAVNNEAVHNASSAQTVWIGLFKDRWSWSEGSGSSFRYWKKSQPNYSEGHGCVAAIFVDEGKWNDLACTSRRRFFCQGGELVLLCKTQIFVVLMLSTSIVTLAAMKYSSTTSPARTPDATTTAVATSSSSTSQGIITYHFTVTNGPSSTQSFTSGLTTVSPSTVTATTELESSTSTADIHTASSAAAAATALATPAATSIQPTTSSTTVESGDRK